MVRVSIVFFYFHLNLKTEYTNAHFRSIFFHFFCILFSVHFIASDASLPRFGVAEQLQLLRSSEQQMASVFLDDICHEKVVWNVIGQ